MTLDDDKELGPSASDEEILEEAKKDFVLCQDAERANREAALDDLNFARLGKQWPQNVLDQREREHRPCMTFNRMPTFIRQIVNDARQNKPAIKVHPADDTADKFTAAIINDLIRNIEYSSNAEVAYDTGIDFAASCGVGYWMVALEYACDDTFDLDIEIQPVANPFSVYRDWASTAADSSDWDRCFVLETLSRDEFRAKYKSKEQVDWDSEEYQSMPDEWKEGDKLVIAAYWRRFRVENVIHQMSDGTVVSDEWLNSSVDDLGMTNGQMLEMSGVTIKDTRPSHTYKVFRYVVNGAEVLEKNEWPGKYIPVIPTFGEVVNIEGKMHLKSLIRDAKDAQRNFNYWRTTCTELVALAPKAPFIGAVGQFVTDADKWARANTEALPYVEYDVVDGAAPPQRQPFAGVPAGALQEALNASDDMKAIVGIYDAALGARSNETSGRAINARKVEADTGTFHFIDNQARAIKHTGRVIIDLIPKVYNKARIVRVIGVDKTPQNVPVNQPLQPNQVPQQMLNKAEEGIPQMFDLTAGKYDLTVDVGPSFQTKREEAAYGMTELLRAYPQGAPVIAPALAKAQDWPGAEELAEKFEQLSPAKEQNPELMQAQQQLQQQAQMIQQLQQQLNEKMSGLQLDKQKIDIDGYKAETERIKVEKENMAPEQIQALINQQFASLVSASDASAAQQPITHINNEGVQ